MRFSIHAMVVAAGLALFAQAAAAQTLITQEEANQPGSPDVGMTTRGLTRGPGIEQVSPDPDRRVGAPFNLQVKFRTRNNVAIDPESVKLTYVKAKNVDLTERIKKHLTAEGIDMKAAEVPPGTHLLRLELKDTQGRSSTAMIKLSIDQK